MSSLDNHARPVEGNEEEAFAREEKNAKDGHCSRASRCSVGSMQKGDRPCSEKETLAKPLERSVLGQSCDLLLGHVPTQFLGQFGLDNVWALGPTKR